MRGGLLRTVFLLFTAVVSITIPGKETMRSDTGAKGDNVGSYCDNPHDATNRFAFALADSWFDGNAVHQLLEQARQAALAPADP